MTILALEFSSEQRSVAVVRGKAISEVVETGGRNTAAFAMVEKALAGAGVEREQIDVLAVGLGPGSYTGIRSAIAIAEGWQLARAIRLAGVSSVEAIAAQAQAEEIHGAVNVVIDAQRGEIYHTRFEISKTVIRETVPLRIIAPEQLQPSGNEVIVGPQATRWFQSGKIVFPQAKRIGQIVSDRGGTAPGGTVEPIYLRETNFVKAPPPRTIA